MPRCVSVIFISVRMGNSLTDVVFFKLPYYRGARVGGYERDESAQAMAQSAQTRPRRGHILRKVPQPHRSTRRGGETEA